MLGLGLALGLALAPACGMQKTPSAPVAEDPGGPPPVPVALLNAVYADHGGLLTGVGPDGYPLVSGADADPLITEAHRFYDTLQAPFPTDEPVDYPDPFTGESTPLRKTAPLTIDEWKRVFAFPAPEPGETADAYRERAGIAIYYNRNELGLGRELGCSRFADGYDQQGALRSGIACFVTNHGRGFRQEATSLAATVDGTDVRNTVAITYRPTLGPGYEVQFYTYGHDGTRLDWARLDTLGPRPHPHICMTCHGGAYDPDRHLAKNSHFLPLDPNVVVFPEGPEVPASLTRSGQEERIRQMNAMALETPLTPAQQALLSNLYGGATPSPGATASGDGVPEAWAATTEDHDFYRNVIKPHCATCHLAAQLALDGSELWTHAMFASPATFDAAPLEAFVCTAFSMPNAQPTSLRFWDDAGPGLTIAGRPFPSPADAFLARRQMDRGACVGLSAVAGCDRGADPDALCGGAVSGGAVCDRPSGRCVPMVSDPG